MGIRTGSLQRQHEQALQELKERNAVLEGALQQIANKTKLDAVAAAAMQAIARSVLPRKRD